MSSTTTKPPSDSEIQEQSTTSETFNASDADVVFRSSDNVLFHIHRRNLEVHAAGFPPAEFSTDGKLVPLSEDASTLERLFQYIYPMRYQNVDLLSFEDLSNLAEAAEKYGVYSVMHLCQLRMIQLVSEHPAAILNYAFRHNYPEVMELTLSHLLDVPLDEAVMTIIPELIVPWVL
ncbi:hypothetical protein C0992_005912 [Termitomyces sp. T32_za158]|nr:hypothetical protein C0992_005912 [Termitomyces sp. T32_za158]